MAIILEHETPFARGSKRACYVHPEDETKCIKLLLPDKDGRTVKKEATWYKQLYPTRHFDENAKDIKGYKLLKRRYDALEQHFPSLYGVVETDLGHGLVTDLIHDDDGSISRDVAWYQQHGETKIYEDAVQEFYQFMMQHALLVRDLNPHNLLVQQQRSGPRIMMIEGVGNSDLIPIANFSRWFSRRKIQRKITRAFPYTDFI